TLYAAGSATLTPTSGTITWPSSAITVSAASPANFLLTSITSKTVAVTLNCNPLTDPATARSCTATDPNAHGIHSWTATPNVLDTWANPATTSALLTITQSVFDGTTTTTTTFSIASGSGVGPQLTASIANGGQVSIALSAPGIQTFTVTNAR
ncbi:MAG TPA: hypothetical protein VGN19_06780, partial [Pedococcus sp.]|nr:hypothetical protein [Pedococcus sp.]